MAGGGGVSNHYLLALVPASSYSVFLWSHQSVTLYSLLVSPGLNTPFS